MVEIDPTSMGFEFAASAVLGGLIGFAVKTVAKLVAVIVGVELVIFRYLESNGVVTVDWDRLSAGLLETQERAQEGADWIESIVSTTTVGVGFASGFLLGYYRA
ncbi:FUN14 domain-containing protein [Halostagnicola kamekurae]|uniref:Uncharacterized membrane protein, Fun14 family n=1 Tax=Halostagnicola kamekurae TaxID=619731 RepID=A0A1I6QTQ1_9EURY|nr:FUN14 domain-containing protein [Halostagnicola kamekurae]SFS55722.1 Uncharacterized membrane protein, Fun14 family [Halostagnicola kamekurae]